MIIHSITISPDHLKIGINDVRITYNAEAVVAGIGEETLTLNDGPNIHFSIDSVKSKSIGPRPKDYQAQKHNVVLDVKIEVLKTADSAVNQGRLYIKASNSLKLSTTMTQNFTYA